MSTPEYAAKAQEIKELKLMAADLAAEIAALEDQIKAAMGDNDQITAGAYKITWKPVTSARIDTTALKKALPDIAERFTRSTTSRRFVIA